MGRVRRQELEDRLLACEAAILIYEAEQRREAVAVKPQPRRPILPGLAPKVRSLTAGVGILAVAHFSALDLLAGFVG